jgi:hypothetical protein
VNGASLAIARPQLGESAAVPASPAPGPGPLIPARTRALLIAVTGPLIGLFGVVLLVSSAAVSNRPWPPFERFLWSFLSTASWSPMLVFCLRWCERRPIVAAAPRSAVAYHLPRAVWLSACSALAMYALRLASEHAFGTEPFDLRTTASAFLSGWVFADLLIYGTVLAAVSVAAALRRAREREREAARLEVALAGTEARLLRAQLDPHFLFNALHAVAGLIHHDPRRADRVVCSLGEFLRRSLESAGLDEVTLDQELEHLAIYVEIQSVRFPDRFVFTLDVERAARVCLVPNLLLQPLVENVVKHAVSARPGRVEARLVARREGHDLVLSVENDGPSPPASGARRNGIGLESTSLRLTRLYGDAAGFDLRARPTGGAIAEVRLPWRVAGAPVPEEERP